MSAICEEGLSATGPHIPETAIQYVTADSGVARNLLRGGQNRRSGGRKPQRGPGAEPR